MTYTPPIPTDADANELDKAQLDRIEHKLDARERSPRDRRSSLGPACNHSHFGVSNMTATETTNLSSLLAANQQRKRRDGWRRYRARLRDAAGGGELDAKHAAKLAEAAADSGVEEGQIERHISAVHTHAKHTARLKELEAEIPAAECRRATLIDELKELQEKLQAVKFSIHETHKPASERTLLDDSVRRITMKHSEIFDTEVA